MFYFTVKHVNISVFFCVKNCVIEGNSKDSVTLHQNLFLGTLFPLIFSQQASLNGGWPLPNNRILYIIVYLSIYQMMFIDECHIFGNVWH